jgi:tRNA-Thr(GGU) m(6)t(6)A37 methyltransferase TsaA
MKRIELYPIGIIHSPYREGRQGPIQGHFKDEAEAWVELERRYAPGLKDLESFSHAILIYYFHMSDRETLQGQPYLEEEEHGIFAIRSPHRPNHLGFSIVKIKRIVENRLYFAEVDMLDGTPVLDIKPYVRHFDSRENVRSGWLDKHFVNRKGPDDKPSTP